MPPVLEPLLVSRMRSTTTYASSSFSSCLQWKPLVLRAASMPAAFTCDRNDGERRPGTAGNALFSLPSKSPTSSRTIFFPRKNVRFLRFFFGGCVIHYGHACTLWWMDENCKSTYPCRQRSKRISSSTRRLDLMILSTLSFLGMLPEEPDLGGPWPSPACILVMTQTKCVAIWVIRPIDPKGRSVPETTECGRLK